MGIGSSHICVIRASLTLEMLTSRAGVPSISGIMTVLRNLSIHKLASTRASVIESDSACHSASSQLGWTAAAGAAADILSVTVAQATPARLRFRKISRAESRSIAWGWRFLESRSECGQRRAIEPRILGLEC